MSFDWIKYVYVAEELLEKTDESYFRSAISRAYYGIFCIARNNKGYRRYYGSDVHRKVINDYKDSIYEEEQEIGRVLDIIRKLRNYADYDEDRLIDRSFAKKAVNLAKYILKIMDIPYYEPKEKPKS
jgi:uncharacterized protein (UPF0332 family)